MTEASVTPENNSSDTMNYCQAMACSHICIEKKITKFAHITHSGSSPSCCPPSSNVSGSFWDRKDFKKQSRLERGIR